MGNIYIVGVPRSGKSTLAKMICAVKPELNLISFEAVRNGFIYTQPELKMDERNSKARKEILPQFMFEFALWNVKMTGRATVVEGSFADMETVARSAKGDDQIVCLGFGGRNLDAVADKVLACTEEGDYIFGCPKEKFLQHFYDLETTDRANMKFCQEANLNYYDTFLERPKVLQGIVNKVIAGL